MWTEHLNVRIIDQSKIWPVPCERIVSDSPQVINFNSLNGFKEKTTNIFKTTNRCTCSPCFFMGLKHQLVFYKYCVLSCVYKLSNPLIIVIWFILIFKAGALNLFDSSWSSWLKFCFRWKMLPHPSPGLLKKVHFTLFWWQVGCSLKEVKKGHANLCEIK